MCPSLLAFRADCSHHPAFRMPLVQCLYYQDNTVNGERWAIYCAIIPSQLFVFSGVNNCLFFVYLDFCILIHSENFHQNWKFCIRCEVLGKINFSVYGCPIAVTPFVEKKIIFFLWVVFAFWWRISWPHYIGLFLDSLFYFIDLWV